MINDMNNYDIDSMIEHVGDDSRHLRQLADGMELPAWCARRRRVLMAVAAAVMIAVPSVYAVVLPRHPESQIACNMQGCDDEVMQCARQIFVV